MCSVVQVFCLPESQLGIGRYTLGEGLKRIGKCAMAASSSSVQKLPGEETEKEDNADGIPRGKKRKQASQEKKEKSQKGDRQTGHESRDIEEDDIFLACALGSKKAHSYTKSCHRYIEGATQEEMVTAARGGIRGSTDYWSC